MKFSVFSALTLLVAASSAHAYSYELDKFCGTLTVDQIKCFVAPCYALMKVENTAGETLHLLPPPDSNLKVWTELERRGGAEVCVEGLRSTEPADGFHVFSFTKAKSF